MGPVPCAWPTPWKGNVELPIKELEAMKLWQEVQMQLPPDSSLPILIDA